QGRVFRVKTIYGDEFEAYVSGVVFHRGGFMTLFYAADGQVWGVYLEEMVFAEHVSGRIPLAPTLGATRGLFGLANSAFEGDELLPFGPVAFELHPGVARQAWFSRVAPEDA